MVPCPTECNNYVNKSSLEHMPRARALQLASYLLRRPLPTLMHSQTNDTC